MGNKRISNIVDFGETAFKGVKIETISFVMYTNKKPSTITVESYISKNIKTYKQDYITDSAFPYWLIYRDAEFDAIAQTMQFDIFTAYRDRRITKANTKTNGKIRVLKSRNIGNNEIINIPNYDCYIDDIKDFDVAKYYNHTECILLPNLTYNPRACFMPENCIADGSVAILTPKNKRIKITKEDLDFFASKEFSNFYAISRNRGSRSLNIDNNSVFFFGKLKG